MWTKLTPFATKQFRSFATQSSFPPTSSVSALKAFTQGLSYRMGRWYYSFYYSQYTNKYILLFIFPAFFFAVRFAHDTSLGYRVYLESPPENQEGSTSSHAAFMEEIKAKNEDETVINVTRPKNKMTSMFTGKYSNGTKVYMEDEATVADLKRKFFGEEHTQFQASCHGRVLEDMDSLAFSVRAFCKRDPKIFMKQINN